MSTASFRPYVSDDLVGVEIGGAVKNVIAIACGMMTGAGFAENTRAALITRGIDEMKALAEALGGRRETVTGLSGAGDLTLTCSSHDLAQHVARRAAGPGHPARRMLRRPHVVVEGEVNAVSVIDLARRIGVVMPICEAVTRSFTTARTSAQTFAELWARPIEAEPRALDIELGPSGHNASERP